MNSDKKKIVQIATISWGTDSPEGHSSSERLVVLTDEGELFIRDLNKRGTKWEPLEGPIPGLNIGDPAWPDHEPLI
jgi:hypothetical protein